jgi:hypothetical protein
MVEETINLRRARRRKASAKAEMEAAANRVTFGVSKSARIEAETNRIRAATHLEAHRRLKRGDAG